LLQDAVAINDKEPGTNFFLGNMYSIKGKSSAPFCEFRVKV
jgi:hypothetical protein